MSDEVKALIAKARTHTACECHFEGVQMRGCGEHGDDESKLIADLAGALEAAVQAPAVDREALARYFYMDNAGWEDSAVEHWDYLIDRIRKGIEAGHDKWLCFQAADRLIASGVLQDAAEVEARGLEKAADALCPASVTVGPYSMAANELRARAQQVREGKLLD